MSKAKKKTAKRMGRPPKAGAKRYSIRITDEVANHYRDLGDGNLTLGIERGAARPKRR